MLVEQITSDLKFYVEHEVYGERFAVYRLSTNFFFGSVPEFHHPKTI